MQTQPEYFSRVAQEAHDRWDLLEMDPDIAAPWWQLFRQVKSPQHVLSELLQNADDAGAAWAACRIEGSSFIFEHNGRDFSEDELRALCAFGRSSKTKALTIGFRGIGFKSVFSLGDEVVLQTPSLSVTFLSLRFTEPLWVENLEPVPHTRVTVVLTNDAMKDLMRRQLEEWASSPLPLLFFRNLQSLDLGSVSVTVERGEGGPIANSLWVRLNSKETQELLVIHSDAIDVPVDALEEVREERGDPDLTLPPLDITLVVDPSGRLEGKLYSVLPAGTSYPGCTAVQAPFMQNPGRTQLKDPASSPLNTWLLRRAASLAATSTIDWLNAEGLSLEQRARAYSLLPAKALTPATVDGSVAAIVNEITASVLRNEAAVLRACGLLAKSGVICLPSILFEVWDEDQILGAGLDAMGLLAPGAPSSAERALASWDLVDRPSSWQLATLLDGLALPAPTLPLAILRYWEYRARLQSWANWSELKIVPTDDGTMAAGSELLLARSSSKVIGADDWDFLLSFVRTPENTLSRLLVQLEDSPAQARQLIYAEIGEEFSDERLGQLREFVQRLSLGQSADVDRVVALAAKTAFSTDCTEDVVRIVCVAARSDVRLPDDSVASVAFLCLDGRLHRRAEGLLVAASPDLRAILPEAWLTEHAVASVYSSEVGERTWLDWALAPNKGGLHAFPRPVVERQQVWRGLDAFSATKSVKPTGLRYKSRSFEIYDVDWPEALSDLWSANDDPLLWPEITHLLLSDWNAQDDWLLRCRVEQISQVGTRAVVAFEEQPKAAWVLALAGVPCLFDEYGEARMPVQLFRRTSETDALRGVEAFVEPDADRPQTVEVLSALGVGDTPASPARLLERLQALSASGDPLVAAARDIYRVLERLSKSSPQALFEIDTLFRDEPLILCDDQVWRSSGDVFIRNPRSVPGMRVVHVELDSLETLWRFLHVPESPSIEDALEWLKQLPQDADLKTENQESVRAIMDASPRDAWLAGVWLDWNGRIQPVGCFTWAARSRGIDWNLFFEFGRRMADMSFLHHAAVLDSLHSLPLADNSIVAALAGMPRINRTVGDEPIAPLRDLGALLMRARTHAELGDDWRHDYRAATALSRLRWVVSDAISVEPRLDGVQAGPAVDVKAFWDETQATLYTVSEDFGDYEDAVHAVAAGFRSVQVHTALHACWLRPVASSRAYVEQVLGLLEDEQLPSAVQDGDSEAQSNSPDEITGRQFSGLGAPSLADRGEPSPRTDEREIDDERGDPEAEEADRDIDEALSGGGRVSNPRWQHTLEAIGFTWTVDGSYQHSSWGQLSKADSESTLFKWRLDPANGGSGGYALIAEGPLSRGFVIRSEQWAWGSAHPETTWILDPELGAVSFSTLLDLQKSGSLTLHAERYRLVADWQASHGS